MDVHPGPTTMGTLLVEQSLHKPVVAMTFIPFCQQVTTVFPEGIDLRLFPPLRYA